MSGIDRVPLLGAREWDVGKLNTKDASCMRRVAGRIRERAKAEVR